MKKAIIGLVGYSGSGKTSFCDIVNAVYDIPRISTGNIVRAEAMRMGCKLTPENIIYISDKIRQETNGFLRKIKKDIEEVLDKNNFAIIDCLREMNDYREMITICDNSIVLYIASEDVNRYSRILKRKRNEYLFTEKDFRKITEFEKRLGIESVMNQARYIIKNDESKKDFEKKAIDMISKIEKDRNIQFKEC